MEQNEDLGNRLFYNLIYYKDGIEDHCGMEGLSIKVIEQLIAHKKIGSLNWILTFHHRQKSIPGRLRT